MSDTQNTDPSANTQTSTGTTPAAEPVASGALLSADPAATSQQVPEGQTVTDPVAEPADPNATTEEPIESIVGAPEAYEFTPPEGSKFDEEVIGTFSAVAKELDLSQGAAQKILDAIAPKVAERFMANQLEAIKTLHGEWVTQVKNDKELGGDNLEQNLAVAEKALTAFGTPELRKLLGNYDPQSNPKGTGMGNHPELIRAFVAIGKAISEDTPVSGGKQPTKGEISAAKALYPDQTA